VHPLEKALLRSLPGELPLILCVSGGRDSSAMLAGIAGIQENLSHIPEVIYFDHKLREESAGEREFVRRAASDLGFIFTSFVIDVRTHASRTGCSIEESAREMRYARLREYAEIKNTPGVVFTAHTADDQAETLLMRFISGTGRTGLRGIRESFSLCEGWKVVRPLIGVSRAEVEDYLETEKIRYVVDKSNFDTAFRRNFVRHRLIPEIRRVNPSVTGTLSRQAEIFAEEEEFLEESVRCALKKVGTSEKNGAYFIELSAIMSYNTWLRRRLLRRFSPVELDYRKTGAIDRLLGREGSGSSVDIGNGWRARKEYSFLVFERASDPPELFSVELKVPGRTLIKEAGRAVTLRDIPAEEALFPPPGSTEYFDPGNVSFPLRARSRQPGDRISPWGMEGSKKVKDLLIDLKIPPRERDRMIVIEDTSGVLWAAPHRRSSLAPVMPGSGKALEIRVEDE